DTAEPRSDTHLDHLLSPVALTDSSGLMSWGIQREVFGNNSVPTSPVENIRFPGQYSDSLTGLAYNHFRYYQPNVGRYMSDDPLRTWGTNQYAYAGGNPLRIVDPAGLIGLGITANATAEGGFVYGVGGTESIGGGGFGETDTGDLSAGGLVTQGGFVGGPGANASFPRCPSRNPWVLGGYAGGGLSAFLTNANSVADLTGPVETYSANFGAGSSGVSVQVAVGEDADGETVWVFSYSGPVSFDLSLPSGGYGMSLSHFNTMTRTTDDPPIDPKKDVCSARSPVQPCR